MLLQVDVDSDGDFDVLVDVDGEYEYEEQVKQSSECFFNSPPSPPSVQNWNEKRSMAQSEDLWGEEFYGTVALVG